MANICKKRTEGHLWEYKMIGKEMRKCCVVCPETRVTKGLYLGQVIFPQITMGELMDVCLKRGATTAIQISIVWEDLRIDRASDAKETIWKDINLLEGHLKAKLPLNSDQSKPF